jgi:hypothetical protein
VFVAERGRKPRPGELTAIGREIADHRAPRNVWRVDSMVNVYNGFAEMLGKS